MNLPLPLSIDPLSFFIGAAVATLLWWIIRRVRPLWSEITANLKRQVEESRERRLVGLEADHRRVTFRHAQGMHLAAPMFALDEVLEEPRLLAPLPRVEPGSVVAAEDAVTMTVPYLPNWPELAAAYDAPTLTLHEALAGGANLVIIGQPGIGKTVALAHLASLAANRSPTLGSLQDAIPFLLHVADLELPAKDVQKLLSRIGELVSEYAAVLDLPRVDSFIQSAFRSGRAILLLDGFDELTSQAQRDTTDLLQRFMAEFPKVRIVTTGAPEYLDGILALGFMPIAVAAWGDQRQAHFVQRWGELWSKTIDFEGREQGGPEPADTLLLGTWLNSESRGLTPLEMTLKIWAGCAGDWLGPSAMDAITAHVRRLSPSNTPMQALEALAMQVALTAQPMFDPRRARAWVKDFEPPEEAQPAEEIHEDNPDAEPKPQNPGRKKSMRAAVQAPTPGLLGRLAATGFLVSYAGDKMRFVHPVLGGYLAGRALSSYKAENTLVNQPDWIGKLLSMRYFSALGDAASLVTSMLQWSRLPTHRPLLTAARWLRDAPRDRVWRDSLMKALVELLQASGLPLALRGQALAALVASNDPGAASLFRQLVAAPSTELAHLAALGSGAIRDEKAVSALEAVMQSTNISARRAACLALAAIGTTRALEGVGQALLKADEDLRRAAAEALTNHHSEGHAMLRDGATMEDIAVRRATVFGLGRIRETWATELLEQIRVEDAQWIVRNLATEMLEARLASIDPRAPRPLTPPAETPWLIAFAGTQGIGIAPGSPATDVLLMALKSSNQEERLAALEHLKHDPNEGVIAQMYALMFGADPELRDAAFQCISEIGAAGYKLPDPRQYGLG